MTNCRENYEKNATGGLETFSKNIQGWLTHRHLPVALAILAVALTLPSLWTGWVADDHFRQMVLRGFPGFPDLASSPMAMFTVADGDAERTRRLMDIGVFPWWTLEELRMAMWRPLSVLTHWLDHLLWPDLPALMHVQSLLWFGGLVATATVMYRRLTGPTWVAGLAALLYAVDDAHGFPAAWLTNRYALLSALFGLLALIAHDRWRRGRAGRSGLFWDPYGWFWACFRERTQWRRGPTCWPTPSFWIEGHGASGLWLCCLMARWC